MHGPPAAAAARGGVGSVRGRGSTQERLAGSATGVFIGMWTSEYEGRMFGASPDIDLYVTTGGGRYAASGRLSYAFDLRGPSLTLDTACSSSLVAVHLACQSLRSGESEMALAGGVNLILEPHITIGYSRSAMLSADGSVPVRRRAGLRVRAQRGRRAGAAQAAVAGRWPTAIRSTR